MLRALPPRDENERIYFFHDSPCGVTWAQAESAVDESHGPIIGSRPAGGKKPGVMEGDHSVVFHETRPIHPITLNRLFAMVSVNEKEIDRRSPTANRILTERFDPDCPRGAG